HDRRGEGKTLNDLGVAYAIMGQYDQALDYLSQALLIRSMVKDSLGQGETLHNIGKIHLTRGQNELAREYFEQA
ncbi:MAG: tetratricopeptide repeat protein, partial [Candidatus Promineifilaceae bacterium]